MTSAGSLAFDLSGVGVHYRGLSAEVAERLRREWAPFETSHVEDPLVDFDCDVAAPVPDASPFEPRDMEGSFVGGSAAFQMKEGSVDIPNGAAARLTIAATEPEKQYLAAVNLSAAALAWRLPARGGAMLHAAGVVIGGRGFVLVGPEGSGKSTFSLLARDGGALILSDDVVVVHRGGLGYEMLGTPFRTRPHGMHRPGRWPLAALLLPEWGSPAALLPVSGIRTRARLLANLPFVTEAAADDDRPNRAAEEVASATPSRTLKFPRDPSFVPILAAFSESQKSV